MSEVCLYTNDLYTHLVMQPTAFWYHPTYTGMYEYVSARFQFRKFMYKIYVQLLFFVSPVFKGHVVTLAQLEWHMTIVILWQLIGWLKIITYIFAQVCLIAASSTEMQKLNTIKYDNSYTYFGQLVSLKLLAKCLDSQCVHGLLNQICHPKFHKYSLSDSEIYNWEGMA
jgi:hypothetical protein